MTFTLFENDDEAYLTWASQNPDGFVLNTRRPPDPKYMVLHRASYGTISSKDNFCGFTHRAYIKVCSTGEEDLAEWTRCNGRSADNPFSKRCSLCKPNSEHEA